MIYVRIAEPSEIGDAKTFILDIFPDADVDISDDDILLLAEAEGKTIGFAHLCDYGEHFVFKGLGVKESMRGKGVGSLLMEHALDMIGELDLPVYLKVKMLNPAIDLYNRYGFQLKSFGETHILVKKPNT